MKIDLFDINEFIKVNKLKEVTSPIALTSARMPNPDGIFSYDIFGYTTEQRKNVFAYIDLHSKFFHPQCLKVMNRMGSVGKIAFGQKYAVMSGQKIKVVDEGVEGAQTGVDFFYDNWEKINWSSNNVLDHKSDDDELSIDKKNRFTFFKLLKKNEAFVDKWLVIPPYYRDFNTADGTLGDDINKVYNEVISRSGALSSGFGFSSFGDVAKNRIQSLLMILYDYSMCPVTGKTPDVKNNGELAGNAKFSMVRRSLSGRQLDFSASSVITSPITSSAQTVDDFAKFGTVQLPLQTFIAMAKPFFLNYCHEFLSSQAEKLKTENAKAIKSMDSTQWSLTAIDKMITRFIKSTADAAMPITFEYVTIDGKKRLYYITMSEHDNSSGKTLTRPMVYLDLLYQAGVAISKDKYCLNTRYPITNNQNIYAAKAIVQSTLRTRDVTVMNMGGIADQNSSSAVNFRYKHYPYISYDGIEKIPDDIKKKMAASGITTKDPNPKGASYYDFQRSTIVGNGHIKSLGADYDGDVLFFRCLFTKEANAEAENMIWRKSNWFNAGGSLSRGLTKISLDATFALYQMTKD